MNKTASQSDSKKNPQGRNARSGIDSDVQEVLELSRKLKEAFKRLEARKSLSAKKAEAVTDAAKAFRWLRAVHLSLLRAAFDAEYAAFLERLNIQAKTK